LWRSNHSLTAPERPWRAATGGFALFRRRSGACIGTAELNLKDQTAVASLVPDWNSATLSTLPVQVTTLDEAIAEFGAPSFCRIDVEGYEPEVLKGLSTPIAALSLEYQLDRISSVTACLDALAALGHYEINLTAYGSGILAREWIGLRQFRDAFPACAQTIAYGDLFARLAPLGRSA